MFSDGKQFDTNVFFSGGAGMFIQYHDIIKPTYLFAIIKLILNGESFGLPVNIISRMSFISIIEWYIKRRFINPLKCLDYYHQIDENELDNLLQHILENDKSIYTLGNTMNVVKMFSVYRHQQMTFPVYIYSEREEPSIMYDCENIFKGIPIKYLFGDLKEAIKKCDQNFTYIFSDLELVKDAAEILIGTCSHILLSRDYRYNYIDNCKKLKYNLSDMAKSHPFVRIGTIEAVNQIELALSLSNLKSNGGI